MRNSTRSETIPLDTPGDRFFCAFETNAGDRLMDPAWFANEVFLKLGKDPSIATVVIPLDSGSEEAADVLAWRYTGVAALIKHGMRALVYRAGNAGVGFSSELVFVGYVTGINRDRDHDCLLVYCADIRSRMKDVAVVGRWIADENGDPHFQCGWDAHFNPRGRPNAIWSNQSNWVFTPYPDYGLEGSEAPPSSGDMHTSKATYWSLGSMLQYLRYYFSPTSTYPASFGWIPKAPADLVWAPNFGACLDQDETQNFNVGVGQGNQGLGGPRKGRDINLAGMSVIDAITTIITTAGGYALQTTFPTDDGKTVLDVVSSISRGTGVELLWKAGGPVAAKASITGGFIFEDSSDTLTHIGGRAGKVLIERRMSTKSGEGLLPAWTTDREDGYLKAIMFYGNTVEGFEKAGNLFPEVYTTWMVDPTFDFQAGTTEESYPRANITRPPWPTQLSQVAYIDGTLKLSGYTFPGYQRPIYVEVAPATTTAWTLALELNGLEIFDTGIIYIPGLRELGTRETIRSWEPGAGATKDYVPFEYSGTGSSQKAKLRAKSLRLNLALPCDHGLSAGIESPDAANVQLGGEWQSGSSSPDAELFDPNFTRYGYVDLGRLYDYWVRQGSYPIAESMLGTQEQNGTIRTDAAYLAAHLGRHLYYRNRLQRAGNLVAKGYLLNITPGQQVDRLVSEGITPQASMPLYSVVSQVKMVSQQWVSGSRTNQDDSPGNKTELILL